MTKNLIAYFSASGVTKSIAEKIHNVVDSDIFEIVPKQLYTSADLNWNDKNSRSSIEMNDKSSRPEIESEIDVTGYDTIILGFPVWWYTAPTIINTFIEENNIQDKNIYVFVTSGSTGETGSFNDLKSAYPENNWMDAKRLTRSVSDDEIVEWLK